MVGRRPQHAISKLACLVMSSAISCRSSICPGRLSNAWLGSLVVFSCHIIWSSSGDTRSPSVVLEAVDMPCPGPFHFSHSVDYIYDCFLSLPQMLVFLSLYRTDLRPHIPRWTEVNVTSKDRKTNIWVRERKHSYYVIAGSTQELYICLFRQMTRLLLKISRCLAYAAQPAMSLRCIYMTCVLVRFLEAVVLSQVYVALNSFYQHIVHVYRDVVYNHHLCLCDVDLKTHSPTFIG